MKDLILKPIEEERPHGGKLVCKLVSRIRDNVCHGEDGLLLDLLVGIDGLQLAQHRVEETAERGDICKGEKVRGLGRPRYRGTYSALARDPAARVGALA